MTEIPGVGLTVTWQFTGQASIEKVTQFVERWVAGQTGIDLRGKHPIRIHAVDVQIHSTDEQINADFSGQKKAGAKLGKRRRNLGLTQKGLARLAGIDPATVSNCETGKLTPASRGYTRIVTALNAAEARK